MAEKAVLCVDDEKIILDSLKLQLKNAFGNAFIYETAENADEAWEVIETMQSEGIQLIIIVSDWLMPGINGEEFLIAVHQRFPHIVKVMLSGQIDPDAIAWAKQHAGLFECILKPWSEEELIDAITRGLEKIV